MTGPAAAGPADLAATRPRHPPRVPLAGLAAHLGARGGSAGTAAAGVSVTGVTLSSLRVLPGDLYAALPGARTHGASYAADAVRRGAVAVLTDPAGARRLTPAPAEVPVLVVPDPRRVLGRLAVEVYGDPAASLDLVGVTGTQGKTTTTRLLEGGLLAAGVTAGVIGTIGTRIAGRDVPTSLTTPEAPDLHALFARMREDEVTACAMEVSSHALVLGRVDGVVVDVAVFLNLGRDHLDFHGDTESYFAAKADLFTPARARRGLVCLDDPYGARLAADPAVPTRTFSVRPSGGSPDADHRADHRADYRAEDVALTAGGSTFTLLGPGGLRLPARSPLPGDFNVANTVAAVAAAAEAGLDPEAVAAGIAAGGGVPGRLERVPVDRDVVVVVDYAHKPDAVAAILRTLRPLTDGRLIVVLGAGGDRDPGKRPVMGEIAARLADVLVVTDDNPRSEDPAAIRAALLAGARRSGGGSRGGPRGGSRGGAAGGSGGGAEVLEVGDRREAIAAALARARTGDIVLVAGKGHETGQEVGGRVLPFDDRQVVRELAGTAGPPDRTGAAP